MADSKRKKTSGYFVTVGTGEKIQYNSNPTRSKPKVTETQKQAAEARVQQYRSAAKENASTQSGLSKPAKITSDVSGEAWTRATPSQTVIPEKTVTSQTKRPSGYTPNQERELSRLSKLRQEAAVNLDAGTMNELDAQMKAIRAQAGKQTFGDRVNDTLTAIMTGSAGQYANAVGFVNNAFKDPDYNRRQIARMQESLKTGVLSDGKPVTPAMRKTIQESIDRMTKEIEEWEAKDSTTNRIYRAADRLGEESAKAAASAKEGLGSVGNTVVDAAVSMGQSTLDAVPALVTGGAAGMAPFVVRAFGGATQEARQKGADMDEQLLYGSAEAAKEYVTEKLFGLTLPQKMMGSAGAGGVDSIVENGIKNLTEKLAKTETGRKVLGGIATWFMSGVGEGAEEIIGSAIENAFINPNLRPWEPDTRTQQQKFEDALYDGLVGAVSGWMGGVTNLVTYDTSKLRPARTTRSGTTVDVQNQNGYNETKVSPAASAQVQQTEAQAQVTQAENPGSTVLDAATTLFTQQGMKLKTAQEKAGIVQKLIAGEEVSVRDINKLNPTSKESQAIFTQLTGVQFPEGKVMQEQLYNLYRSAHDVAVQAETVVINSTEGREAFPGVNRVLDNSGQETPVNQMSEEQILEQAKTIRETANPEADARAAQALAQMRGEIAPDGNALLSFKEFSDFIKQQNPKATREETARLYDQYLKDNQTVEFRGQRLSHMQFMDMVRNAPTGSELTEAEAEDLWQREVKRQQDLNYNKEDSRNGQGQSAVYGAGLQGQSDQRSGMDAGGLYEGTGRAESESGTRGEYGTRSEGAEAVPGGHGEGSGGLLNNDAPVRASTAADGRTVFNEVSEAAWSEDMKRQTQKFSRVGIRLRAALDRIPIPGTNRYCDGVSHLGVESIVQSDSPFFTFEQLCDHESGHQYFFRDRTSTHTNLYKRCVEAYKSATTPEQRQAMFTSYLGEYADVYAQADKKTRDQLRADIREEIICDAYAGMNRNGYGADQLQDVIKPIIDEWCAQRDAEMQTTDQKYSIDSMAEAVGLTFEKDGQVTVFKDAKGNAVDEVTEDHIRKSPLGAVIQSAVDANLITKEQAGQQVKFFSDLYNMMLKTQDIDLLWAVSSSIGFQPLESGPRDPATVNQKSRFAGYTNNADPQYSTTVDFTTICVKTQAIIDAMSETMMRLGRGLTEDEIVNVVYKNTHEAGEPVPCPVCYVFSRWVGLGGLFEKMNLLQTQYENVDEAVLRRDIDELEGRIYDIMVERGYAIKYEKKTGKPKLNGAARDAMYKEMSNRKNELTAKKNLESLTGKKEMTAAERTELEKLNKQLDILDNWTWLRDVRLSENYEPVPPEILYNINAGKEFAEKYPESWKFRTTRGPAMGKAATPYADEHLGQILRGAGVSDVNKADLGDPSKNPFLKGKDGELTKTAKTKLNTSRKKIKAQNLLNGQRYQSTSDFRFEYALDYLLSFVEMQALGGKVQLYTKVAESVPMFASVNSEVNCSLMPLGIGYRVNPDGSKTLVFSSVTGMNAEDAFNLSAKYDNVQPIMVGVNNEHIRLCMADDRITFIIPYHASGASEGRYVALMKVVGESVEDRTDYSEYQGDHVKSNATPAQKAAFDLRSRILTGKVGMLSESDRAVLKNNDRLHELYKRFYGMDLDGNPSPIDPRYLRPDLRASGDVYRDPECFGVTFPIKKGKVEIPVMPFEYWDRTSTIDTADKQGEAFIEYCESLGLHPRFSGWDSHGVYHPDMDLSKISGYWKFLGDRALYNNDGTYHEQQAIDVTNFNADYLFRDKAIKGIVQPSTVNDPGKTAEIVEKSVAEIQARTGKDDSGMAFYDTKKKYSVLVEDKDTLDFLNNQKTIKTYKTMQLVDGKLYPPMASRINGKFEDASELGKWEQATEHPELIKNGNKFKLDKGKGNGSIEAAYNPYMHSSNLVINDQFTGAYTRDNLVTVECEVPVSEVTSGYHAEYAKDSVGWHSWHTGTVAGQIRKEKGIERQVFLSRWIKPVRIVPDSEVASMYKTLLDGTDIAVPDNVVTPSLRDELKKEGVKLQESGKVKYSITEYTDEQKREHDAAALKYFGNTDNWNETGYLTLDGKKLDFSGRHDGARGGYRTVDHRDVSDALGLDYGGGDYSGAMVQFMAEGNIRISPESNGINLSVLPTEAQERALEGYISRARGEVILDIDDTQGNTISSTEYPKGTRASKVLSDIRQYFKDGTEPYVPNTARYRYSITGENDAVENEKAIRKLENEIEDINSKLDLASVDGLSEIEVRRLQNQLTKSQYELDQRNAAERKAAVRTPLQTVLDNLDNYRAIDLESIANQLTDNVWDDVETLSTEELKSGIREIIQERAGDMSPLEMQAPKFGVYVRKPSTSAGVRYSITQDSMGRELTKEQQEFFKDSKVRDAEGRLTPVYHGTPNGGFTEFKLPKYMSSLMSSYGPGFYFTDKNNARQYMKPVNKSKIPGTRAKLYETYLNITNPFEMSGYQHTLTKDQVVEILKNGNYDWFFEKGMFHELGLEPGSLSREKVIEQYADKLLRSQYGDQDVISEIVKAYTGEDNNILDVLKKVTGNDGLHWKDGYGDIWVAWDANQIKNVSNKKPTESTDIRYSITPEFEQWYLEGFTDQDDRDRVKQEIEDLRTKYGTIPVGENPVREVNLPRKIDEKTRVHDTARTVMEAEATPEKRLADIQKAVLDGKLADVPVKNDVVARRARARVEKNGWQTSLTDWTAKVRAGETSADLVAEGAVLLNNAGNSDMSGEQYVELLTDYSNLMHRTGQSLQAARILKTLSPEGRLYGIQKTVDQLNDNNRTKAEKKKGFDPAAWAEQNEIKLDPALVDAYRNAKTDTERDFLLGQIQQNIADQMPASLSEKLNNWRYLAMLGNFRTQIRNVLGNFFFQIPREVKETVAGGIEGALEKAGVKIDRTRSVVRDNATYKAAMKDFDSVRDIILSGGKVNEKMSYLNGIDSKRRIYKNKVLEGYRRVVNTAMDSGDAVFCKFTYADSLARFMAANHTTWDAAPETLREKGRLLAIKEAAEATYRDNNAFSEMVLSMRFKNPGSNKAKKAVNAVVEGILPFRKTPANILVRGVEYSPLGLVKTAVDTVSAAKGSRNITGSDLVNEFAKSLTGSGLFALGYFLTKLGVLTALGPDDDDKEKEFWELQGNQSYSINLFGRSYTIDWLAPEAIPLLVGANTAEIAAEEGLDLNAVTKAATRITDPMLEMSMLQGVNSLIENIANTKTVAALPSLVLNSLWSYGLQYVPTLTGQLNRAMDNTRRTTYTDATSGVPTGVQYSLGKLSQKVPGWSYNQIPYIDQWGRMEENYESKPGNAFAQFLSPAYQSIPETSDMERELQRLYDATGETGVLPSKAPKYLTVDGERRDLTAEEYVNYATLRGQTAYDMLTDLTGSSVYRKMSDKDKVKAVGEIYSYAADLAKQDLLGGETKGTTQKAANADSYGISSAEYAALKTQTAGIESLKYKDQTDDDGNPKTIQNSRGLQTMEAVYSAYPNLTKKQYEALFEALGVGKTIRGYSKQMVQNKLKQMRRQAAK